MTTDFSPESDGRAEGSSITLMDMTRKFLLSKTVYRRNLLKEAVITTCFIQIRLI